MLDSDRVKVYPYILPNLGKHDYFLGDGVTVIVSVTQNGIENLDAGGSIPVILTSQNGVAMDVEGGAEALGKKLISSRTISFTSPK